MTQKIRTHLMFDGQAAAATQFYIELFPNSAMSTIEHYEGGENDGKVRLANFKLNGVDFIAIDTPVKHDFGFTPSMSVFVDCDSAEEFDRIANALSDGGVMLMPRDNYGFSQEFVWLNDRFGVSWQLNLP